MFKHECVKCLEENGLSCMWNISFFNRFFGTKAVLYCPQYIKIMEKKIK